MAGEASVVSIDKVRERRKRRQQLIGIAAAGVIVLGGGGFAFSQFLGNEAGAGVSAGADTSPATELADRPDLDEGSLPGAVGGLVTGGEGGEPLRLEGTPAPDDCVAAVSVAGVDQLIGVIEIRYGGRDRDAVFFTTSDPTIARVIVVDDCSLDDPEIAAIDDGQI